MTNVATVSFRPGVLSARSTAVLQLWDTPGTVYGISHLDVYLKDVRLGFNSHKISYFLIYIANLLKVTLTSSFADKS